MGTRPVGRAAEARSDFAAVASVALLGALLYVARDFLIPVALAGLLGFLLHPLVARLERAGVPRFAGILLVALAILAALGLAAWFISGELGLLLADLPSFKATFLEKLRALRGPLRSVADALGWIDRLSHELEPATGQAQAPQVEIVAKSSAVSVLGRFLPTMLGVFATAGIVVVLTVFMLVQSDLPKRIVSLLALHDSRVSPRALDEAGALVSGFLERQALVCLFQGAVVWLGLWLIGVPGAFVFGFISALLRSIPYFGPTTAAALPIAFTLVAFHGFAMTLWTLGFFVCLELFTNNVLDPRVLGRGAGLTPFGVIFAATFWAWLWGPPGLVLAIPLTACLTVVGRYMPQLAFLPALLAQDSVATPAARLYERLAEGDDAEAAALLRRAARDGDLLALSDSLLLPLLAHVAGERAAGRCSRSDLVRCLRRLRELLGELVAGIPAAERDASARPLCIEELRASALDRFARDWLATVLERRGFEVQPRTAVPGAKPEHGALLVLTGVGRREVAAVLGSARGAARVRGRDVLVLAVAGEAVPTWPGGAPVVSSCAALVAAFAPAPIAGGEGATGALEAPPRATSPAAV